LARAGKLPLELVDVVATNQFPEFQQRALELSKTVDAFFILNHDTMRDANGEYVDMLTVGRWYLENINKPEVSHEDQFVQEGMLAAASDSGFNQSFKAFEMAYEVLEKGQSPGLMSTAVPPAGPLMVNRVRAEMLGISLDDKMKFIDEVVEDAIALN